MTSAKPRPPLIPGETRAYPVLPLRDIVVFPHMIAPLFVLLISARLPGPPIKLRSQSLLSSASRATAFASFDLIRHHRVDDRVFLCGFDNVELNATICAASRLRVARPRSR